ncbi:NSFL1 cofactor p47 [Planococcus citri]|uniref:NSFL1 cofactor p47 n=1 Tax=Planococcus citri TaxID=170843 RepID=UPI0031F95650
MDDNTKSEVLAKFASLTGVDEERAKFYLDSSDWNLELSLTQYYDDNDGEFDQNVPRSHADVPPTVSQPAPTRKPEKKSVIKSTGNIRTLSNIKQAQDSESSDEEDGQAFYAGGSEHSGQQVLGPPRARRSDIVTDVFRSVRGFGAEVADPRASSSRGQHSHAFSGTGYRLGETGDDSQVIPGEKTEDQSMVEITVRFWKNGFSVNDGPLRPYDDPKNQEFLHHVKHGEVPNEFAMQVRGREISFTMEDNRHAEYTASSSKSASFSGAGQKLGSITPTLSSPSLANESSTSEDNAQANPVEVDNSKPTTNIQIRLADGSRLVGTFNHNHTVGDIRRYINASSPQYRDRGYILMSTFPRKEFTNNDETIEQSGLINSVIMQHLVA